MNEEARDAARYRWLRDTGYWYARTDGRGSPWCVIGTGAGDALPACGQELDAAVDAGMADMPPIAGVKVDRHQTFSQDTPADDSKVKD